MLRILVLVLEVIAYPCSEGKVCVECAVDEGDAWLFELNVGKNKQLWMISM